jgi:tripartite-type tricarboxylate transporter receptor subunit TctC
MNAIKLPRRKFLHLAAGAAAMPAAWRIAWAQAYPSRPVRIIVGFPAGGNLDMIARLMGQWLSERLGQPFIIENRPGAGTNIATETVVRAPADGYTLLMVGPTQAINATLYEKLNFNFIRDIAPVAGIISTAEHIKAGRLRALAVTTATRSEVLPDVPTVGEFVPDYEASTWYGVGAPKAPPADIVDKLNREFNAGLADPKIKARLADLGGEPMPMTPPDFGKFIVDETEKWAKVVKFAGLKPE